jgi:hypothetical protein
MQIESIGALNKVAPPGSRISADVFSEACVMR